jgi:hypothetical protein
MESAFLAFVILNLFQDNKQRWFAILKQVQDDEKRESRVSDSKFSA